MSAKMEFQPHELAALDAAIARGLADAEAGRTRPAREVFDRLEARYREAALRNNLDPDP